MPGCLAFVAHETCQRDSVRSAIRLRRNGRRRVIVDGFDLTLPDRRFIAAKLTLDGFAEVLQQMKAIGDLLRLRRALTRGLGIEASAVAADHLHVGMVLEPVGGGPSRTIRQHVHHHTTLQVHNDRAVIRALPPRPVVNTSDMDRAIAGRIAGLLLQAGQDRRVADRHPEPSQQPLRRPPACAMAKQLDDFRQVGGPARERRRETRQALGEDALIASLIAAPPSPQTSIDNDRRALGGQIPKRSRVGAVARIGQRATPRTGGWQPTVHRDRPRQPAGLDAHNVQARRG